MVAAATDRSVRERIQVANSGRKLLCRVSGNKWKGKGPTVNVNENRKRGANIIAEFGPQPHLRIRSITLSTLTLIPHTLLMGSASSKQDGHSSRKLVIALASKRKQQKRQQPTSKSLVQEVLPIAGMSSLPSEIVEMILTYVWHGPGITALPGTGEFQPTYHDPTPIDVPQYMSHTGYSALQTSVASIHPDIGLYPRLENYRRLSLVHPSWHIAMQRIALTYVSLTDLGAIERYSKVINWQGGTAVYDQSPPLLTPFQQRSRLLCRTLHAHFATGNLTQVPSWPVIAQLLPNLPSLTHLIITAAEAHPALGGLLESLPSTVRELDIHISSVYKYKMPLKEIRLDAVKNITHLLLSAYDVKFLQKALEPFTPPVVPRSTVAPQATLSASGPITTPPAVEELSAIMHPHASLCTLSLVGPHRLTDVWFEATSHLTSIKTLRLYELHAPGRAAPTSDAWALGDALNHAPWLPKLEWVYVQRGLASGLRDEEVWGHIVTACGKRGVHLLEEPNNSQ